MFIPRTDVSIAEPMGIQIDGLGDNVFSDVSVYLFY